MSSSRYKQALRILERWPKDHTKGEHRDIAVLLRKRIGESFSKGDQTVIQDAEQCDKMLLSLENICDDKMKKEYAPSTPISVGALGLDYNVTHQSVSDAVLAELNDSEKAKNEVPLSSYISKIFRRKKVDKEEKIPA